MTNNKSKSPATGRHAPAQGAAANTVQLTPWQALTAVNRKPRVAKIDVMRSTNNGLETIAKYSIEYYFHADLFENIHEYFCTGEYALGLPEELRITFPSGRQFFWNFNLAHYCFAHGRIEVEELVRDMRERAIYIYDKNRRAAV
jgi:hypothetical protein